jgi:hypothetical protein
MIGHAFASARVVPPPSGGRVLRFDHERFRTRRLRELLDRVTSRDEIAEVWTVIDLLKQMDELPVHYHRPIVRMFASFRELPPGAQERLLALLSEPHE